MCRHVIGSPRSKVGYALPNACLTPLPSVSTIQQLERSKRKVLKKTTWTVTVGGRTHKVQVQRKPWLAIGEVRVDGERVTMFSAKAMSITIFHYRQHPFTIDDTTFMVVIKPNFFGYAFDLTLNGEILPKDV